MNLLPPAARRRLAWCLVLFFVGVAHAFAGLAPLAVSANHRYLQDATGKPFFLVGDCPQNLPLKLAVPEFDAYMADCEQKGFNLLWICIDGQRDYSPTQKAPVDRAGRPMMNNGWEIATLNEAYFETIDAMLDAAGRHSQYCMLTPLSECQWTQANINKSTPEKWRAYGKFLGQRYKDRANILWQMGNDTLNTKAQHAIVAGIKEAGDRHLMTVNWRPGHHKLGSPWARKHEAGEDWIDLDAWYENAPTRESGVAAYWQKIEYQRPDPMPSFLSEGPYQKPDTKGSTDLDIRKENYYVALGGGCGGHVYGAGWLADPWDYASYIHNGGRVQTIHFKKLFEPRDWTGLVPDYDHAFVTEGYGELTPNTRDYVGAALNGGTLGLAYCPRAATITVALAKFGEPVTARWYDPTNGQFKEIAGAPFANAGTRQFTTPGSNGAGDGDWVLLLEAAPAKASAQKTAAGAGQKTNGVPVIYCTDLFHPHDDPDDHFDLATLYAIKGLDVRAIILDQGEKQRQKPGRIPVAMMNRITGRNVPAASGLATKLKTPADKGLDQAEEFQAGVRLILDTLRASDRPVAIAAVGSMRDLAAAFNREPTLMRAKVGTLLIFIGEASDPKYKEYNVNLDPQAYICLMRSGLPVYWVPCFDGGSWQNRGHASFWRAKHEELLRDASPALIQYFIYALDKEKSDPMAFLAAPVDPLRKQRLFAGTRNLWCTEIFEVMADFAVASPLFGFSDVEIAIGDDAVVHYGHTPNSTRIKRFEILDAAHYAAGMTSATARLLSECGHAR